MCGWTPFSQFYFIQRLESNQVELNDEMIPNSTKCGWIQWRNYWKAASHVHITNDLIIYNLTKFLAPYPTQTTMVTEDQCCWRLCVRSQCGGAAGGGGGAEGSPGITAELRDKRDIVALTDPSKKTLLPVPSDPASSAHELLTSQNWKSLFNIICCSTLTAAVSTNQMQTLALKHSSLCRTLYSLTFKLTWQIKI